MSTDADDVATAKALSDSLVGAELDEREHLHAMAIAAWASGDWLGAAAHARRPARTAGRPTSWPLMFGHQLDFFLGDAANLRDRPGRSLPRSSTRSTPTTASCGACTPFGLEESGHHGQALDAGLRRRRSQPRRRVGRPRRRPLLRDAGHGRRRHPLPDHAGRDWADGNLFTVHNWWHLALYLLEAGQPERVAGHLRRPGPPRRIARRAARDARRRARCCGGCTSTGSTPATASRRWPTPGPPTTGAALVRVQRPARRDGATPVPAGSPRPAVVDRGQLAAAVDAAAARTPP